MQKISSDSSYTHSHNIPQISEYLYTKIKHIIQKENAKKILDIGCGNASLFMYLSDLNIQMVGIEPSDSGIIIARKISNATFYQMGVYDDPAIIAENSFDIVVSTEVIEHLFYPRELLRFAKAKLKPGGKLVLTTPYHGYMKNLLLSLFDMWDKHHTVLWDGGHIKFWSKSSLSKLLKEEGFEVNEFIGCGRIPYVWKSMLMTATTKV